MRWIWIDRIIELDKASRCVAIKNITLAEEVLRDHFPPTANRPALAVMPNTLIIEGMAQTAGILIGHANDFSRKVILAKISKAVFQRAAMPGRCLEFIAQVQRIDTLGAAASGQVNLIDPATSQRQPLAQIDLMFSHIDQNRSGLKLPDHNFVFTSQFMDLLAQSGFAAPPPAQR